MSRQELCKKSPFLHFFTVGICLIALFVIYFKSILFSNFLLVSDGLIPASFEVTSWSNLVFSGYPLISDPIWFTFYPVAAIIYKILHLDFNFFIISGYFLMAFFTYWYVYELTGFKTSAFVGAIIYGFSGYGMYEIGHAANFIHTICWLPLVLLAFEKLKNEHSYLWTLIAILAIPASISAGFPQLSLAMCPVLIAYAIFLSAQSENKVKKAISYFSMIIMGFLIALPIIIPTFILSLSSNRVHLSWEAFCTYFVEVKQLLLFNFPYVMGGYYGIYKTPPFGNWEIVGNHGFVGFLSLILAGIAVFFTTKKLKPVTYFWLAISLFTVAVSLGPQINFLYNFLYKIPVVNNFRAPERYLFIFALGISVLAGLGLQAIQQGLVQKQKKIALILSILFAGFLMACVLYVYPSLKAQALEKVNVTLPSWYKNQAIMIPLAWMVSSLIALFFFLRNPKSFMGCLAVMTILFLELTHTAYYSYWHPEYSGWSKEQLAHPPAYISALRDDLNTSHQRYLKMQISLDTIGRYLWGNFPLLYQLPSAGGYMPLAIEQYLTFLGIATEGAYYLQDLHSNQAINIAGIKYLFSIQDAHNAKWFEDSTQFKPQTPIGDTIIYQNLNALPRLWFTSKLVTLSDADMLQAIHSGKFTDGSIFNPKETALTNKLVNIAFEEDKTAKATIQKMDNKKVVISAVTQKPQYLVFSDVYYPGWKVYIDGKKRKIYKTDYIYRGVVVPAGTHTIEFKYFPIYLYASYFISALTFLFILVFYFPWKRKNQS